MMRSVPRKVSLSTFHAWCSQGKQMQNRAGFYWCAPAVFSNGHNWVDSWMTSYAALSDAQKETCGLCFDAGGTSYSLDDVAK